MQNFGIHSNTSARGFIKCTYKKKVSEPYLIVIDKVDAFIDVGYTDD